MATPQRTNARPGAGANTTPEEKLAIRSHNVQNASGAQPPSPSNRTATTASATTATDPSTNPLSTPMVAGATTINSPPMRGRVIGNRSIQGGGGGGDPSGSPTQPNPSNTATTNTTVATPAPGGTPESKSYPSSRRLDLGCPMRKPSVKVVEKEKKTDYWKDVAEVAQSTTGDTLKGEDLDTVISRAMSFGIVGDRKQRESLSAPKAQEVLQQMAAVMEKRVVELTGGQNIPATNNIMDKILLLEKTLTSLEANKTKKEEEERLRVQNKISELEKSLKSLEAQKAEQREKNRQTMKLDIANIKEMMTKVQQQDQNENTEISKQLTMKMAKMEAALRLMNEERKKEGDDKETLLLKRKLALFEQKLKEMEEERQLREEAENDGAMREKLTNLEEKLEKMERHKSVSMTQEMQSKIEVVEKQMAQLRAERANAHSESINTKIAQKMQLLELQLKELASQKIIVNDPETVALRNHISKLEESIVQAEKRMEDQRMKIEEERKSIYDQRKQEEEAFRKQAMINERALLARLENMQKMIKDGGGGSDEVQSLLSRLAKLEQGGIPSNMSDRMAMIEQKLEATQKALEEERNRNKGFLEPTKEAEGPALEAWQKDAQIAWLARAQADLIRKLEESQLLMDKKIEEFLKLKVTGGGAPDGVPQSGMSYKEINEKLAEIQKQLFNPDIQKDESERLNIEYEKLITELESTDEYKKEQEDAREKWKKDNEAPNKAAFEQVTATLKATSDQKLNVILKRKPELKFLQKTPEAIMKAHVNDFKQVSTQNLNLLEARALYHIMPSFRKDQEQQLQFVVQLQAKIEQEMSKPQTPAPPPIAPTKKVVIKKKKEGGGGGGAPGFLEELMARKKKEE